MHFDPLTHTYTDGGVTLPSVTTLIEIELGLDNSWYARYPDAAKRGTAIHEATALIDRGEMVVDDFDEWMGAYLDGWMLFKIDTGFEPHIVERIVGGAELGYAGTVDRVGQIQGVTWVLDIKTGQPQKWHPLQTAAYALAIEELVEGEIHRGCVYLNGKGKYKLKEHENVADYSAWNIMMGWRQDRERYK
jgi:CRISPR/Cas system-associated exonuclease Cas4 (RecB family)